MPEGSFLYCDVSVPAPLDQPFTYALPETLRHRVRPGCRIAGPLRSAQTHRRDPPMPRRSAAGSRARGAPPHRFRTRAGRRAAGPGALDRGLLLRAAGRGAAVDVAAGGGRAARQDMVAHGLRPRRRPPVAAGRRAGRPCGAPPAACSNEGPLSAAYLAKALPLADKAVRSLERKGFIVAEHVAVDRDPLRAPSARLRVELAPRLMSDPRRERQRAVRRRHRTAARAQAEQARARAARVPGAASRARTTSRISRTSVKTPARRRAPWRARAWLRSSRRRPASRARRSARGTS